MQLSLYQEAGLLLWTSAALRSRPVKLPAVLLSALAQKVPITLSLLKVLKYSYHTVDALKDTEDSHCLSSTPTMWMGRWVPHTTRVDEGGTDGNDPPLLL